MSDSILKVADYLASVEHRDLFGIRQQRLHAAIRAAFKLGQGVKA